jgi:Tfp pilus assembly protein PilV
MSKHMKRYFNYVKGMSLIETLFASAALSVVVVTGLTVASDTIKSKAKGDARVAMLSENVASIEKARHDVYADGETFNLTTANDEEGRTIDRQRLLDADKGKLNGAKSDSMSKMAQNSIYKDERRLRDS